MKSEERHELQQNDLADKIAGVIERVAPYWLPIAIGVVVLLGAAWAAVAYVDQTQQWSAQAWEAYAEADGAMQRVDRENPEQSETPQEFYERKRALLEDVVATYPNSPVADFAELRLAEIVLDRGKSLLFTQPADSRELIEDAIDRFESLTDVQPDLPDFRQRAVFGMGVGKECLGQVSEARKLYEQLAEEFPDLLTGQVAKMRAEALEDESAATFYQNLWDRETDAPTPSASALPGDPLGGDIPLPPGLFEDLPAPPALPKLGDPAMKKEEPTEPEKKADTPAKDMADEKAEPEKKAEPAKGAAEENPAEAKSAPEKKAGPQEKPAEPTKDDAPAKEAGKSDS